MMENGGFGVSGFCRLYRTVNSALRVGQHGPQDVRAARRKALEDIEYWSKQFRGFRSEIAIHAWMDRADGGVFALYWWI